MPPLEGIAHTLLTLVAGLAVFFAPELPCYPRVRRVAGVPQRKACRTPERMTGEPKRRIVC